MANRPMAMREAGGQRDGQSARIVLAWIAAVLATFITAGLALELAKYGILLVHGISHGLPYRISLSVGSIVLYGVLFVAPATVARLLWGWLYHRADPATVTAAILVQILTLAALWPALLARDMAILLGR